MICICCCVFLPYTSMFQGNFITMMTISSHKILVYGSSPWIIWDLSHLLTCLFLRMFLLQNRVEFMEAGLATFLSRILFGMWILVIIGKIYARALSQSLYSHLMIHSILLYMLWFKFIFGLMFFQPVSILFAIVPDYGNEYMTKENNN